MVDVIDSGFGSLQRENASPSDFLVSKKISPEQALFREVVVLAWIDAFDSVGITGKRRLPKAIAKNREIQQEAREWLTSHRDKNDRDLVCALAGYNGDWIAERAREKIEAEQRPTKVIRIEFERGSKPPIDGANAELRRLLAA